MAVGEDLQGNERCVTGDLVPCAAVELGGCPAVATLVVKLVQHRARPASVQCEQCRNSVRPSYDEQEPTHACTRMKRTRTQERARTHSVAPAPYLTGIAWLSPGTSDKAPPSPPHAFSQLPSEQSPWMLSTNAEVRSFQLLMYAPSAHRASQLAPAEPPTALVNFAGKAGFGAGGSGLAALLLPTTTIVLSCCAASSALSSGGGSPLGAGVSGGATGSPAALHASDGLNDRQTSYHRGRGKTSRTFRAQMDRRACGARA